VLGGPPSVATIEEVRTVTASPTVGRRGGGGVASTVGGRRAGLVERCGDEAEEDTVKLKVT
jgi:hypothetical protein